jgi:hypothetical protein
MMRWMDMQNTRSRLKTPTKSEPVNMNGRDNIENVGRDGIILK